MAEMIDLHIHSTHSDGSKTTAELLAMLQERGATIFSFTDHDSIGCYRDLIAGKAVVYPGATLIPGVEITCSHNGDLRDILGYGIDIDVIGDYLDSKYSLENRIVKQKNIVEQFKAHCEKAGLIFDPSVTATEGKKAEGFAVMYNELMKYPENIEKFPFLSDATVTYWEYFANKDSDFYVNEIFDCPTIDEAVSIIHKAGGKAFLAHPYYYRMSHEDTEEMVRYALAAGIDGVELKHSTNRDDDVERILGYAEKYHLLMSGGSDYHGDIKPGLNLITAFGNMKVEYEDILPWIHDVQVFAP